VPASSAVPRYQAPPSSVPRGPTPNPYVTTKLALTRERANRFRFELTGPVLKAHVGEAALAVVHAIAPLAAKRKGGAFFTGIGWMLRQARTQDGLPLTPKQIKTGLRRAVEVGLLEPGAWRYRWNKRTQRMSRTYERALRCWPEPRAEGRCYMVDGATKRKVEAMTGHGGKRAGSGPKKGSKQKPSTKPRHNPHMTIEEQEDLFNHILLEPETPHKYIDRRGLKPRGKAPKKPIQEGPTKPQGGPYTSSLREEEKSSSSFGRKNGGGDPPPRSDLFKSPDATPVPPVATPQPDSWPAYLAEQPPAMRGLGLCFMGDRTPYRTPTELLPPFPSSALTGSVMTPKPPSLKPEMDDDAKVELMLQAYRGAMLDGKPARRFVREKPPTGKERTNLLDCAAAMLDEDIAPAMWAMFSCEVWSQYQDSKGAPPRRWMFSVERVQKHHGWFHNGWDGALARRVITTATQKDLGRRWYALQDAVRLERPVGPVAVAAVVERFFPDGLYSHLCERSMFETKRMQRELNERAANGVWVW